MLVRFDSFLHGFKGELVVGRAPLVYTSAPPHLQIPCPYPVSSCAASLLSLTCSDLSLRLSLTFSFLISISSSISPFFRFYLSYSLIQFAMSLRIYSLIKAIALCKFSPTLCGAKVLTSFTGAEMVIHPVIFAFLAAAMLAQKAGGKTRPFSFPEKQ